MIAHQRRTRILQYLDRHLRAEASELRRLTEVSSATLRRDLDFLESQDLLVRVHGAVLHPVAACEEPSLVQKRGSAVRAKERIGRYAAGLVSARATVFLDSGTTCLQVARHLREREDLTIVTNSLAVVAGHELFKARLVVLGGERRAISGALVGPITENCLEGIGADIAFIGASGLDTETGPGTTELTERRIKSVWIRSSRRAVVVSDATKWESAAAFAFSPWSEISDLVTDKPVPGGFRLQKTKVHIP